jgi:hypothetical protein
MPLLKGSTMRIYMNTNQAQSRVNIIPKANNPYPVMNLVDQTLQNGTNPLMLASINPGQGGSALFANNVVPNAGATLL